jgi:hypothetical protein
MKMNIFWAQNGYFSVFSIKSYFFSLHEILSVFHFAAETHDYGSHPCLFKKGGSKARQKQGFSVSKKGSKRGSKRGPVLSFVLKSHLFWLIQKYLFFDFSGFPNFLARNIFENTQKWGFDILSLFYKVIFSAAKTVFFSTSISSIFLVFLT